MDAESLLTDARLALWGPHGADAREYLLGRGLKESTIRSAGLGWTAGVQVPTKDRKTTYRAEGIVIPWRDGDRLALAKIRQPDGRQPKYAEAFRDRPRIFPSPRSVRPGIPLIVVEGEFDALLLGQELGEQLASVITLGSASMRPTPEILPILCVSPSWWIATDDDEAGDLCAASWPSRATRVRPPAECNDWTEAFLAGVGLRRQWSDLFASAFAFNQEQPT